MIDILICGATGATISQLYSVDFTDWKYWLLVILIALKGNIKWTS